MVIHTDEKATEATEITEEKLKNAKCKLKNANCGIGDLQFAIFILRFAIDSLSVSSVFSVA
jgi:hypothetical protein